MRYLFLSFLFSGLAIADDLKWDHAAYFPDCAPHDGPSTAVSVVTRHSSKPRLNFPQFAVNYWGPGLANPSPGKKGAGFQWTSEKEGKSAAAAFCPKHGSCSPVESWKLDMQISPDGDGTVDFEFTQGGKRQAGKIPLKFVRGHQPICG